MSDPLNQIETIATLSVPRYAPRLQATPIPGARWDDEPLFCLKVNDEWLSHILGVLGAMDQPDTWVGTPEEIYDARQQVNEIMVAFMEDCDPMSNCCPEPNRRRMNPDGTYEISYDGGATWQDGSDFDPRVTSTQFPPLPGDDSDSKRCQAAANVTFHFEAQADQLAADAELWSSLGALVAAFVGLLIFLDLVTWGALTPLIVGLAGSLFAGGRAAFIAALTADAYITFQCIIYCHMDEAGEIDASDLNSIYLDINTQLSGIAAVFFAQTVYFMGVVGINNMAATNTGVDADCLDCDCDIECDPTNWSLVTYDGFPVGSILSTGPNYIIVQGSAHVDFGTPWNAMIQTASDDVCCEWISTEKLTGDDDVLTFGVKCPNARWPDSSNVAVISGDILNTVYIRKDAGDNFTAKITFG